MTDGLEQIRRLLLREFSPRLGCRYCDWIDSEPNVGGEREIVLNIHFLEHHADIRARIIYETEGDGRFDHSWFKHEDAQ